MRSPVMNGAATALHLRQVLAAIPERPILLLWDHAPWHQGPLVRALLAENPRLEILPLPVAAPEMNPQEQVWKATRGVNSRPDSATHCRVVFTTDDRLGVYHLAEVAGG
jgi:transposase